MRLPGRAWLQFEVEETDGGSIIRQTAVFDPAGVLGRLYWYGVWPVHGFVFRGMIRGIARGERGPPAGDPARCGEDMSAPADGLAAELVGWMADHRPELDARMAEEASFAIHEEFMLAESGTLPDRATRIERARQASARAWMRHLGRGLTAVWPEAEPDLAERIERWAAEHRERREALILEEEAIAERRGASGDPQADQRDAELAAHCRFFAETLATVADPDRRVGREPARVRAAGRRVVARAGGLAARDRGRRRARRGARRRIRGPIRPSRRRSRPASWTRRACRRRPRCGPTCACWPRPWGTS